ncbi:MAG: GyrI-like domain-containing protein [Bacteroidota bacterium]
MEQLDSFKIIGISVDTTNEQGQAADLEKLWATFYAENVPGKVPNKASNDVYAIYTDYESDFTGKYTAMIGLRVNSLSQVPAGMIGREFTGGTYQKIVAKGAMPRAVVQAWQDIWSKDKELSRAYTADFEVYRPKSQNGENSEVDIYVAVNYSLTRQVL